MLILLTILFIIGTASLSWVLFQTIQPEQVFSGWQTVMDKAYKVSPLLEMFIGGCYKCFANFISQIVFIVYLVWQYHYDWIGWLNILVYLGFISCSIVISMFINKGLSDGV